MKWLASISVGFVIMFAAPSYAEENCMSAADRSVVMLEVISPSGVQFGAGVIFAVREATIFIVTAAHVVDVQGARINVNFLADRGKAYHGRLVSRSSNVDVAFIVVEDGGLAEFLRRTLDWQLLPSKGSGAKAGYATIIGNNGGRPWSKPVGPERIMSHDANELIVDSRATRPGASGGGLFDPSDELLGIVYSDVYGQAAQAFAIERVLQEARRLGLPVDIRENRLATPAVFVAPLRGAPADWGNEVAETIRQKLWQTRRVIECENERAIGLFGNVEIATRTLMTDAIRITWRFTSEAGAGSSSVVQYLEISHPPFLGARDHPDILARKTDEAADFAVENLTRYLAQ